MNISTELTYLAAMALVTSLMWVPYVLNMILVRGLKDAVGYPAQPKPLAPWAERMKCAHANQVENLVVFAALILTAHAMGVSNGVTVTGAILFFWTRIVHFAVYTFAIPWLRTLAFVVGVYCQVSIAVAILF